MSALLLAFVAVALTSIGARDQLLVARLVGPTGRPVTLLLLGCTIAALSAAAMAWFGQTISGLLAPNAKQMLVAIALLMAAIELAWPNKPPSLKEPTRSLIAVGIVLLARQLGDGSRFLVFALAAGAAVPSLSALGGALGGMAAIAMAWAMGEELDALPLRGFRLSLAVVVLVAAVVIGLGARGIIA